MQQFIGLRFGKPELDGISVVGCSLNSGDIVLTLNAVNTNIIIDQLGVDNSANQPQAGFVGNKVITGLNQYTKYEYTASQNGVTVTGYTWTAPGIDDDYIVIPITCDNNGNLGGVSAGGYTKIKAIALANPDKAVYFVHMDDHYGYMDNNIVHEENGVGHEVSGYPSAAETTALVYDYALGAFSAFGLYDETGASINIEWGQNEDRIWCMRNIPVLPQWGDHDCGSNEMGWELDPNDNVTDLGNGITPKKKFDSSKEVWDVFLAPLHGDFLNITNSTAWSHTLGCVKFIANDGISKASGDATVVTNNVATEFRPPITLYGSAQSDDLITACDDIDIPFKFSLMNYGLRWTMPDNVVPITDIQEGRNGRGCQNPIAGNESYASPRLAHTDYKKWITDVGGIMSKDSCNGKKGVFMMIHGDYHCGGVQRNANDTGNNNEWFYSINVGTVNGSINFPSPGTVDTTQDGTKTKMESGTVRFANNWWVVPFFVYGSRPIKEVEMYFYDNADELLWSGKVTERSMNDVVPIGFNVSGEYSVRNSRLT